MMGRGRSSTPTSRVPTRNWNPNTTNPANGNTIQTVPVQDHHQTGAALVRPVIPMATSLVSKVTTTINANGVDTGH